MRRANSHDQPNPIRRSDGSSDSPSFDSYSSVNNHLADIAARVVNEFKEEDGNPYEEIIYSSQNYVIDHENSTLEEENEDPDHDAESDQNKTENTNRENEMPLEKTLNTTDNGHSGDEEDNESESEFEFAVLGVEDGSSPISADEIFQNGQIRTVFPLFNTDLLYANTDWRYDFSTTKHTSPNQTLSPTSDTAATPPLRLPLKKLLLEDRDPASCSSSEADDIDGIAPDTYCVWSPNQSHREEMSKKSNSTGSSSKRWRLRHLLNRSHSDGSREPFFSLPERGGNNNKEEDLKQRRNSTSSLLALESKSVEQQQRKGKGKDKEKEKRLPPAPVKGGSSYTDKNREKREADRRKKSYLPYRQDLLGFFSGVNGVSRTIQPF